MSAIAKWNLTAQRVGWVAMQAAQLEFALQILEVTLIRSDIAAPIVVGQNWGAIKVGCLSLLKERIGPDSHPHFDPEAIRFYRSLTEAIKKADRLIESRNNVVHATWGAADRTGEQEASLWKRWGKMYVESWTPDQLEALANELADASLEIFASANRIRADDARALR